MRKVKMDKGELKVIVQKNRDEHRKLFEEAWEGFRTKAISNLESRIDQIKDGGTIELYIDLIQPEDHTEDYDRVLSMLEYEVDEEVELQANEFAQYVQDDWGWKHTFNSAYTATTGKRI